MVFYWIKMNFNDFDLRFRQKNDAQGTNSRPLGIVFYPTLSTGITLHWISSGGSGDSAAAGSAVCSAAHPFLRMVEINHSICYTYYVYRCRGFITWTQRSQKGVLQHETGACRRVVTSAPAEPDCLR